MHRISLAAISGLALLLGCSSPEPTPNNTGGTEPVPYVQPPTASTVRTQNPAPVATGVVNPGGTKDTRRPWLPHVGELLRPPGSEPTERVLPADWPWENRGLAAWQRWFVVHAPALLLERSAAAAPAAGGDAVEYQPGDIDLKRLQRAVAQGDAPYAAVALATHDPERVPVLRRALAAINGDRSAVIWALGLTRDAEAVNALRALLNNQQTPEAERLIALAALGNTGKPRAIEALLERMLSPGASDAQRSAAATALGMADDPSAVPYLVKLVADRSATSRARAAALGAWVRLQPREALTRCIAVLQREHGAGAAPREMRLVACQALGAAGDPTSCATLQAVLDGTAVTPRFKISVLEVACDQLPRNLRERVVTALRRAVEARGPLTAAEAAEVAAGAASRKRREAVAKAVGGLLGRVSAAGVVRDEAVRGYAALSLGRCAVTADVDVRAKAAAALTRALTDDHYAVRGFAALGLGFTRDPAGRDALRNLLRAPDPAVRSAGAIGLGLMGDTGATAALVRLASDGPPEQRWGALWGLGLAGADALLRPADRLLAKRSHPGLRATAAEVLLGVRGEGHAAARRLLEATLNDRNRTVRRYAARALGLHAGPHALAKMARVLQTDATLDGDTRRSLIEALAATGPAALPVEAILHGLPAEVAPELAAAALRTFEPRYRVDAY
jgi:HEAT repeat protein